MTHTGGNQAYFPSDFALTVTDLIIRVFNRF